MIIELDNCLVKQHIREELGETINSFSENIVEEIINDILDEYKNEYYILDLIEYISSIEIQNINKIGGLNALDDIAKEYACITILDDGETCILYNFF